MNTFDWHHSLCYIHRVLSLAYLVGNCTTGATAKSGVCCKLYEVYLKEWHFDYFITDATFHSGATGIISNVVNTMLMLDGFIVCTNNNKRKKSTTKHLVLLALSRKMSFHFMTSRFIPPKWKYMFELLQIESNFFFFDFM